MQQAGRVRLRLGAPAGAVVQVVGSWNDWQAPGHALDPKAPGVYEAWLALPAGSHRYHFLVDGQPRRPPDSPQYAADGFGGEDGVLEVPAPRPERSPGSEPMPRPSTTGRILGRLSLV